MRGAVLLLGNFDGFHRGHQALLAAATGEARRRGAPLGVMSCEPHPRQFFRPDDAPFRLTTVATKLRLLAEMGLDYCYMPRFDSLMAGTSAEAFVTDVLVAELGVSAVVAGPCFRFGRGRSGDVALLRSMGRSLGFGVTEAPCVHLRDSRCSSTLVRSLVASGDIASANEVLGHDWLLEVVRTQPSANAGHLGLVLPDTVVLPPDGTYSVRLLELDHGLRHPAHAGRLVLRRGKAQHVVAEFVGPVPASTGRLAVAVLSQESDGDTASVKQGTQAERPPGVFAGGRQVEVHAREEARG